MNNPKFCILTGKDFIDPTDFDKPIKTLVDGTSISPIDLDNT